MDKHPPPAGGNANPSRAAATLLAVAAESTITVSPVYDGPPAPDATPAVVGAEITLAGPDPVDQATMRLSLRLLAHLWGEAGHILAAEAPE